MKSGHSKATPDQHVDAKLEMAELHLQSLLAVLDQTEGCAIVALHVDQAINAIAEMRQR